MSHGQSQPTVRHCGACLWLGEKLAEILIGWRVHIWSLFLQILLRSGAIKMRNTIMNSCDFPFMVKADSSKTAEQAVFSFSTHESRFKSVIHSPHQSGPSSREKACRDRESATSTHLKSVFRNSIPCGSYKNAENDNEQLTSSVVQQQLSQWLLEQGSWVRFRFIIDSSTQAQDSRCREWS